MQTLRKSSSGLDIAVATLSIDRKNVTVAQIESWGGGGDALDSIVFSLFCWPSQMIPFDTSATCPKYLSVNWGQAWQPILIVHGAHAFIETWIKYDIPHQSPPPTRRHAHTYHALHAPGRSLGLLFNCHVSVASLVRLIRVRGRGEARGATVSPPPPPGCFNWQFSGQINQVIRVK